MTYRSDVYGIFNEVTGELEGLLQSDMATASASMRAAVAPTPLGASRELTAADDGKRYYATAAITLTIPAGLAPRPEVVVLPPPAGNLTIAVSGGATTNGATAALTFTRAAKPAGIVITPYPDAAQGYGAA